MELSLTQKRELFKSYFKVRKDVYATYVEKKDDKTKGIYQPTCKNKGTMDCPRVNSGNRCLGGECPDRNLADLNEDIIAKHILGEDNIGGYPLFPDGTCYFVACDIDTHAKNSSPEEAYKTICNFYTVCINAGVPLYVERSKSGKGYHGWIFFEEATNAHFAREIMFNLLYKADIIKENNEKVVNSYDRIFPNQSRHSGKKFGNLINLPLQGKFLTQGNTAFLDPSTIFKMPYSNQWDALADFKKIPPMVVQELIDLFEITEVSEEKQDKHFIRTYDQEGLDEVLKCDFIAYAKDCSRELPEPLWWSMITNLIFFKGGPEKIHEYSRNYDGYSFNETDYRIKRELNKEGFGPHTCSFIRRNGFSCKKDCPVKAPAGLPFKALKKINYAKVIDDIRSAILTDRFTAIQFAKNIIPIILELDGAEQEDAIMELEGKTKKLIPSKWLKGELKKTLTATTKYNDEFAAVFNAPDSDVVANPETYKAPLFQVLDLYKATRTNGNKFDPYYWSSLSYNWIKNHGGEFYRDKLDDNKLYLYYEKEVYHLHSNNAEFNALIHSEAHLSSVVADGKMAIEGILNLCLNYGEDIGTTKGTIRYYDQKERVLYLALGPVNGTILKIIPGQDPIEIQNFHNDDNVCLFGLSGRMHPIKYNPKVDVSKALNILKRVLCDALPMERSEAILACCWAIATILSKDFSDRPIVKLSGAQGSGKTSVGKLLTALFFGSVFLPTSTMAALYEEAVACFLLILDNIEEENLKRDPWLGNFFLKGATGDTRMKRSRNRDHGNVYNPVEAMIMCNGIENFDKPELLRRCLELTCSEAYKNPSFSAPVNIRELIENRNDIFSALFKLIAHKILPAFSWEQFGDIANSTGVAYSTKKDFKEYIALMLMIAMAINEEVPTLWTGSRNELAKKWIDSMDSQHESNSKEQNTSLHLLNLLLQEFKRRRCDVDIFKEMHGINMVYENRRLSFTTELGDLFNALSKIAKEYNLSHMLPKNALNFSARLRADERVWKRDGWSREKSSKRSSKGNVYRFTKVIESELDVEMEFLKSSTEQDNSYIEPDVSTFLIGTPKTEETIIASSLGVQDNRGQMSLDVDDIGPVPFPSDAELAEYEASLTDEQKKELERTFARWDGKH